MFYLKLSVFMIYYNVKQIEDPKPNIQLRITWYEMGDAHGSVCENEIIGVIYVTFFQ